MTHPRHPHADLRAALDGATSVLHALDSAIDSLLGLEEEQSALRLTHERDRIAKRLDSRISEERRRIRDRDVPRVDQS